jgi:hypothetical protein
MTRSLRVKDLTSKEIQRAKLNHETYKELYLKTTDHVRRRNELGFTTTRYHVPSFIVGRPIFNHDHAVRYVTEKLQKGGFKVIKDDNEIIIDWTKQKKDVIRKKAPKEACKSTSTSGGKKPKIDEPLHVKLARLNHKLTMNR